MLDEPGKESKLSKCSLAADLEPSRLHPVKGSSQRTSYGSGASIEFRPCASCVEAVIATVLPYVETVSQNEVSVYKAGVAIACGTSLEYGCGRCSVRPRRPLARVRWWFCRSRS